MVRSRRSPQRVGSRTVVLTDGVLFCFLRFSDDGLEKSRLKSDGRKRRRREPREDVVRSHHGARRRS